MKTFGYQTVIQVEVQLRVCCWLSVLFFWAGLPASLAASTAYTNLGPGDHDAYGAEVIRLALDKTIDTHGPYRYVAAPSMNEARALQSLRDNNYEHGIRVFSTNQTHLNEPSLRYVPFPIFLGVYSYRVCWLNKRYIPAFANARTLEDLRSFTFGQMEAWVDTGILRSNGLQVVAGVSVPSLYRMVDAGRIHTFCRGAMEPQQEQVIHAGFENISLDEQIVLYYPLPHFLFVHRNDKQTADRLHQGFLKAYADGSLLALWHAHFAKDLARAHLSQRRVISLRNDNTQGYDSAYEKFMLTPLQELPGRP